MGIREARGRIVVDRRWPDRTRFTRVCLNRTKAKNLLDRINGAIAEGRWQELKEELTLRGREVVTLEDFGRTYLEEYVTSRNKAKTALRKQTSLNSLIPALGRLELESITPARLHGYVRRRKEEGVSNATVNRDLATIKHLLNYAEEAGVIGSNPIDKFRTLKEDRRERRRFRTSRSRRSSTPSAPTAGRCSSSFWKRDAGGRRRFRCSGGRFRRTPGWWSSARRPSRASTATCPSRTGRWRPSTLCRLWKAVPSSSTTRPAAPVGNTAENPGNGREAQAGVPDLLVKDLRHHYAIKLAEAGADMHDIQQVLGHASVATTERHYAQFSPKHSARKILRVLEGGKRGAEAGGNKTETRRRLRSRQVLE